MSGKRQPTDVVEANGKKHLSDREKALREQAEVRPSEMIKKLQAPTWLPAQQKKHFASIAQQLIDLMQPNLIRFDAESIGMYCILQAQWLVVTNRLAKEITSANPDAKMLKEWRGQQSSYFSQAHQLAADMGLTITSRCQLVVPKRAGSGTGTGSGASPPSPLVLLAERRKAASNG